MSSNNSNSYAREYALKYLYHLQLEPFNEDKKKAIESLEPIEHMDEAIDQFDESFQSQDDEHPDNILNDQVKLYANKLIKGVLQKDKELEELIKNNLVKWTIQRLDKLDYCLLMIGAYEVTGTETPKKVAIDEAIKLSKKYGTKDSYTLVNAVLDKIAKS